MKARIPGLAAGIAFALCTFGNAAVWADDEIVTNTYLEPRPQSPLEYEANFVYSSVALGDDASPACDHLLYIDFEDKEMFATVLLARALGRPVDIHYNDEAPARAVFAFSTLKCKLTWIDIL